MRFFYEKDWRLPEFDNELRILGNYKKEVKALVKEVCNALTEEAKLIDYQIKRLTPQGMVIEKFNAEKISGRDNGLFKNNFKAVSVLGCLKYTPD